MKFNHKRMTLNKMKCNLISYYLGVNKKRIEIVGDLDSDCYKITDIK